MSQIKNYPNTPQVNLPQPHVTIPDTRSDKCRCSGWLPFVSVGICAILFLILVTTYGGAKLFPVSINIYAGLVPIVKKGFLQVLPFVVESNKSIPDSHVIKLPLQKAELTEYIQIIDGLLKGYPEKHEEPYRNCWLQNPSIDHPCFYDRSWITEICSRNNSYGYDLYRGEYSPCFLLKFNDTKDWKPLLPFYQSLTEESLGYPTERLDHGFIPVICKAQDKSKPNTPIGIDIYPPKGYSVLYFPQSKFGSSYLSPVVTVKINGIRRKRNVTVDCAIVTPNAFELNNNGRISITFSTS